MATGWVRAWEDEADAELTTREARSNFRKAFTTSLHAEAKASSGVLVTLHWGDEVELPTGIKSGTWTKVKKGSKEGFARSKHLVELAYVTAATRGKNRHTVDMVRPDGKEVELLWGDLVQITKRSSTTCEVRARGQTGEVPTNRLDSDALLDLYFIDVGQGDGVLIRLPSGRHMLIDGGLPRSNQMTGKNAADFVDWKFFADYGHYAIKLDAMVASHCDYDHYGGLWDLVRLDPADDNELDCIELEIDEFYHAGLSRWKKQTGTSHPHKDDLGPNDGDSFLRLLGDRSDAEAGVVKGAAEELGGDWKSFLADLLERQTGTTFTRLGVRREDLQGGGALPEVWPEDTTADIRVLAPVSRDAGGHPVLKDLGDRGQNTNGHSVCLRIDYGDARILLTGDLNKNSMDWLIDSYGDRVGAWACDVAKACHHGSADISYRFLEEVKAAATVISSGDAEGHAHPRPEVVAASAVTGHVSVDRDKDKLVTPLIYMTEIERSVSLGKVTHIGFRNYPAGDGQALGGALFAMRATDIPDKALPNRSDRLDMDAAPDKDTRKQIEKDAIEREKQALRDLDEAQLNAWTRAAYHYRTVHKLFNIQYDNQSVWKSRIMTQNHYGLVNVRTDGETILCATMKEAGDGWTVHTFPARFG